MLLILTGKKAVKKVILIIRDLQNALGTSTRFQSVLTFLSKLVVEMTSYFCLKSCPLNSEFAWVSVCTLEIL